MSKVLKARVIEGTDVWYDMRELEDGFFENVQFGSKDFAICAPCNQEGFNSLFNVGKTLNEKGMCSKFEIAAFDNGVLFWKTRPDKYQFESNGYVEPFDDIIEKDPVATEYLTDYQERFWKHKSHLVSPSCFEDIVELTLLTEALKNIKDQFQINAVPHPNLGFEYNGIWITNPFFDETLRNPVDPVLYYGIENTRKYIEEFKAAEKRVEAEKPSQEIFAEEQLKSLVRSENIQDRMFVARQGYALDTLINDHRWLVRQAVAEQNFGLDRLINDVDIDVALTVKAILDEQNLSINEWIVANPDRCVLPENRLCSLKDQIANAAAKKFETNRNDRWGFYSSRDERS